MMVEDPTHPEKHDAAAGGRTNWLRAAVLGANDGIVSVAGLVVGVIGATPSRASLLSAGLAGMIAGSLSMGVGEYVSVSSQRDTERAMIDRERTELSSWPDEELLELARIQQERGLSSETAGQVALQFTATDALRAHAEQELGLDPQHLVNPWTAALASIFSFLLGALLPLLAVLLSPEPYRLWVTVGAVLIALALTGYLSAYVGQAGRLRAARRVVGGGALVMAITYGIGRLVGELL